ncbi:hypothetical protein HNY73_003055 [Argiope bruennichi]|uniref:Uncharacterized protein n=1 Tax=Argiope bruennichi TaxID=94029 RepID=A0A8T0FWU1_ARGBR|nr:hypothetical protein HNY73_003055 [Argiope bruennichi]
MISTVLTYDTKLNLTFQDAQNNGIQKLVILSQFLATTLSSSKHPSTRCPDFSNGSLGKTNSPLPPNLGFLKRLRESPPNQAGLFLNFVIGMDPVKWKLGMRARMRGVWGCM